MRLAVLAATFAALARSGPDGSTLQTVALASSAAAKVPLCAGLTIVTAVSQKDGDYESIKTIQSMDGRELTLRYSTERMIDGTIRKFRMTRTTPLEALQSATLYLHHFDSRATTRIPDATSIGTSAAVLRALRTQGSAQLAIVEAIGSAASVDRAVHPNLYDYQMTETIRRVGTRTVNVLVNDVPTSLAAIHAAGDYYGEKAEFLFLDDEQNPMALKYRIGRDVLDVVKITFACTPPFARTDLQPLEQALVETGRVDVYSIHFSFNSDEIREESEPVLEVIAELLRRRSDWRLGIGGHTDSIASSTYNLELSRRRAAAVKHALVTRYGIDAQRLTTTGHGEASPIDTNDTLEGRARNRRVELVRIK